MKPTFEELEASLEIVKQRSPAGYEAIKALGPELAQYRKLRDGSLYSDTTRNAYGFWMSLNLGKFELACLRACAVIEGDGYTVDGITDALSVM